MYADKKGELGAFHLENPLFVFVGHTVSAASEEDKKTFSDVADILAFFKKFSDKKAEHVNCIAQILSGISGLLDDKKRDIFARRFSYLGTLGLSAEEIYDDILRLVFNSEKSCALMRLENIKGTDGEIAIRMGNNVPFGLINVGNASELIKILKKNGFETADRNIGASLFQTIDGGDSTINLLVGSKKISEGWNCWRVSTMGLMNVGRSEGSEIIQLFGRGVRLMGYDFSLKRSATYKNGGGDSITIPKHMNT